MKYSDANHIFRRIRDYILDHHSGVKVKRIGSLARESPTIGDLDFLIVSDDPDVLKSIKIPHSDVLEDGDMRKKLYLRKYKVKIDLFRTDKRSYPFALLHFIGNKDFNIRVRAHAKRKGYKLNQYGLFDLKAEKYVKGLSSERKILEFLGVTYKEPKDRIK